MFCVNTSHPQFKVLLEQTGLHPDLLKAEVSIWMDQNNSDSFPTMEELQLSQMTASERAMDPMAEWINEFDTLEELTYIINNLTEEKYHEMKPYIDHNYEIAFHDNLSNKIDIFFKELIELNNL